MEGYCDPSQTQLALLAEATSRDIMRVGIAAADAVVIIAIARTKLPKNLKRRMFESRDPYVRFELIA